jgi:hypothetical protein
MEDPAMRSLLLLLLLMIPASAFAAERTAPPPSAARIVRYHPSTWQLPAGAVRAGMRFDPESGETTSQTTHVARGATAAALKQSAEASLRTNADGSRHAVLGAAFRSWTVVRIADDGRLVTDCVKDLDEAKRRLEENREVPR